MCVYSQSRQLEALIEKNFFLHKSARAAYMAYVNAYAQHGLKDVFNVHALDLLAVAKYAKNKRL